MPAGSVFISYRRDDSAGYARALGDELAREFGAGHVFIDVDDIAAGAAFGDVIQQQLGRATLLLVLIGRRWLGEREGAPSRLFDADDFVRREVVSGLARGAVVLPVLLDGAAMPQAQQLPPDLRALTGRQALSLDNARYADDLQRLMHAVRAVIAPPGATAPGLSRRSALAAAAGSGVLLIAAGAWWALRERAPARAAVNGRWQAELDYGWANARYTETFDLQGDDQALHGTASFLRVPRGIVEGRMDGDTLVFSTRSTETLGSESRETVHRYRLRLVGDELQGMLQTEGGSAPSGPVTVVARRAAAPAGAASAAATVPP
jgi:TIR domain